MLGTYRTLVTLLASMVTVPFPATASLAPLAVETDELVLVDGGVKLVKARRDPVMWLLAPESITQSGQNE